MAIGLVVGAGAARAATASQNVAIVPEPRGVGHGGELPTSNFPGGYAPAFTNVLPTAIRDDAADPLTGFDTVVLAQLCDVDTYLGNATFKSRVEGFVQGGGKLLIWDSECQGTDYSKFVFPFTTDNPGGRGANGKLTDQEDNSLGNTNVNSQYFVDYGLIGTGTDAVGDANVFTSFDQNYCLDLQAVNANGVSGPVQVYASYGNGLIIYDGLDYDRMSNGQGFDPAGTTGSEHLGRIWLLQLQQSFNPSKQLPCAKKVFGIALTPKTASNPINTNHTVTASVSASGEPQPDVDVTFTVISGPNQGKTATVKSDANGIATFTYTGGSSGGTDTIEATATLQQGERPPASVRDTATKDWIAPPPPQQPAQPQELGRPGQPLAPPEKCQDNRIFFYHLHHGPHSKITRVRVWVNGTLVKTVRGKDVTTLQIDTLPLGKYVVQIITDHTTGGGLKSVRTYDDCVQGKPTTTRRTRASRR